MPSNDFLARLARRVRSFRSALVGACLLSTVAGRGVAAQEDAADLERRLPSLSGLERARALSRLGDEHKLDAPEQSLRYAAEALTLFRTHPDAHANISTLSEMLWPHMATGRYDSAAFYADSARRFAERVGDRVGEARAISNLGVLAQRMGDPFRAVEHFTQSLAMQRAIGNEREISNSLNNLGFVYSTDLADYATSLSDHLEALAIRERLGDETGIALSLNNIGIVYARLREYDHALDYFARALALRKTLGNKARIAATLSNIGDAYLDKHDPATAMRYQRAALALRIALEDRSAIALSRRTIGVIHLALHNLPAARRELLLAQQLAAASGDRGLVVQARLALSAYERERGAPPLAVAYAQAALALADSMRSRELSRQASTELAIAQEQQGELAQALDDFKRSKTLSDSIFNAQTSERIARLERAIGDQQRLRDLEALERSQADLRAKASERALQRNGAAAIALIIAIVAFFLHRRRVEGARLAESLSVTDTLTGLRNRRYVQQTIEMDVAASLRRTRAAQLRALPADDADLVFFMLDLDHFKEINDEHGHAAGDRLLVDVSGVLRATCRDSDVVVRWGGDEFVIVARFTDRQISEVTAERLRGAVAAHVTVLPNGRRLRTTCSIGFAAFPFDLQEPAATTWEEVLAMADQTSYAAKRNGRNRWASADRAAVAG